MKRKLFALFSIVCLLNVVTDKSQCDIVVHAIETGGNVEFSGGGTADLTGLVQNGLNVMGRFVSPDFATFSTGGTTSFEIDGYGTPSGPSTFGSGGTTLSDSTTGDQFGMIGGNVLAVPNGYVSNTPLFGTSTYNGASFNSLGMVPGTYVWTWGQGESFTLFIGAAIPEPATASICTALSLAGLLLSRRRR